MHDVRECYRILGVSSGANQTEIRRAYLHLVKKFHPDHHGGSEWSKVRFQEINEAYQFIQASRAKAPEPAAAQPPPPPKFHMPSMQFLYFAMGALGAVVLSCFLLAKTPSTRMSRDVAAVRGSIVWMNEHSDTTPTRLQEISAAHIEAIKVAVKDFEEATHPDFSSKSAVAPPFRVSDDGDWIEVQGGGERIPLSSETFEVLRRANLFAETNWHPADFFWDNNVPPPPGYILRAPATDRPARDLTALERMKLSEKNHFVQCFINEARRMGYELVIDDGYKVKSVRKIAALAERVPLNTNGIAERCLKTKPVGI